MNGTVFGGRLSALEVFFRAGGAVGFVLSIIVTGVVIIVDGFASVCPVD